MERFKMKILYYSNDHLLKLSGKLFTYCITQVEFLHKCFIHHSSAHHIRGVFIIKSTSANELDVHSANEIFINSVVLKTLVHFFIVGESKLYPRCFSKAVK